MNRIENSPINSIFNKAPDYTHFRNSNYFYYTSISSLALPFRPFYYIGLKIYNFFSWIQFLLDRPFRLQKVCDALYQGNHYFKRHSQWLIHQRFDIVFTLKKEKLPGLENTNIKQVLCSSSEDLMKSVTNALEVGKRIFVDCPSAESYLEALKTLINKEVERLEALAQTLD